MKKSLKFLEFNDWFAQKEYLAEDWIIVARTQRLENEMFDTFSVLATSSDENLKRILSDEIWEIYAAGGFVFSHEFLIEA